MKFPFGKAADSAGIIRDTIRVQASAYRAGHQLVPGSGVEFRFITKPFLGPSLSKAVGEALARLAPTK